MATGLNKAMLIGNLGQDPEVRYTQGGNAVCNLRLALNERRKEGDGWKDHVEWMTVVCFGKTAENAGQYLSKGRQVFVEGRLQTRKWTDKQGVDHYSTEVVAFELKFLGGRDDAQQRSNGGGNGQRRANRQPPPQQYDDGFEDDLPF